MAHRSPSIACVIVTHDRPVLLRRCLDGVLAQGTTPSHILVLDNASGPETAQVLEAYPQVEVVRLDHNAGGAAGFAAGIATAILWQPDFVWLMDDDGRAAEADCLQALLARAVSERMDIVGPLVLDEASPERLAFPIRVGARTHFLASAILAMDGVESFAHLFNGTLIRAEVFARIGLPDARFFIRGDEVEFLYRSLRAELRVITEPKARFLHPGSTPEINPILFGAFYAVLPFSAFKRFHMFRNRAYIFSRYGMFLLLAADVVRYGWLFLVTRHADVRGLTDWARATAVGLRGDLSRARSD